MIITLYIEYVFIISFIMNYIVLYITGMLVGNSSLHIREGTLISTVIYSIALVLFGYHTFTYLTGGIIGMSIAVIKTFSITTFRDYLHKLITTFLVTIITGAMIGGFLSYTYAGYIFVKFLKEDRIVSDVILFILYAVVMFKSIVKVLVFLKKRMLGNLRIYGLSLKYNDMVINTHGLLDSGNSLYYGESKEPVSIVEYDLIKVLLNHPPKGLFTIAYKSLGQDRGTMYGIVFDEMTIVLPNKKVVINKPRVGIYKGRVCTNGEYNMIIHKDYIDKM